MPAPRPRPESADTPDSAVPLPGAGETPAARAAVPSIARLADDHAVPAASPVHRLQAELARLAAPEVPMPAPLAEPLYPGWFRLGFPLASSALIWAGILWGAWRFA